MNDIIKLIRPHQWIKNLFVFAPMFFSFHFDNRTVLLSCYTFIVFSLTASSVYILNDYKDINEDREHPVKRMRPLASGAVSANAALLISTVFVIISISAAYVINIKLMPIIVLYIILNVLYTYILKHIPIVDISVISSGFILRILAGAVSAGISVSSWIILVTFQLAMFLALAKRRDDLLLHAQGKQIRKSIHGYDLKMVNAGLIIMGAVTIVSYQMYTMTPAVINRLGSEHIYLTTIFVIIGILRYLQITFVEKKSGSPTMVVIKDKSIKIIILCWIASFILIAKL